MRAELDLPDAFPPEVEAEALTSSSNPPVDRPRLDTRFITIDPAGARDLDQAVAIEPAGDGWLVRYAIADVAAWVRPSGAVDTEARRRGVTIYLPDGKVPLHPPVLSEGAASLLPDGDRPAVVWTMRIDAAGHTVDAEVARRIVRSGRAYTYPEAQAAIDAGTAEPTLMHLREAGRALDAAERERGGMSLPVPDQEIVEVPGGYGLVYRTPLPVEGWNAQISLLAGRVAARRMLDAGAGVVRTVPPPDAETVARLRRQAVTLGVPWPEGMTYPELVRSLDVRVPDHAALAVQAARLLRGAGYIAFLERPDDQSPLVHSAVAAPYAHVTAPLRRLVDRFATETAVGRPPQWVLDALPLLPDLMADARRREGEADRMAIDLVESAVLRRYLGAEVTGTVIQIHDRGVNVQLREPAVVATVAGAEAPLGDEVCLRVTGADLTARRVDLQLV